MILLREEKQRMNIGMNERVSECGNIPNVIAFYFKYKYWKLNLKTMNFKRKRKEKKQN